MELNRVYLGDSLELAKSLEDESVDCVVTSPPYYGLRDYGTGVWEGGDPNCKHYRTSKASDKTATGHKRMQEHESPVGDAIYKTVCPLCGAVRVDRQIGLEETPEQYIDKLVSLFREIRRALKKDGTIWINIGDSYNGSGGNHKEWHKNDTGFQGECGVNCAGRGNRIESLKPKDLIGIPWMLAFALRADGWYLRQDIIWHKPNPMPESVTDRCTKSHEYIFLFSKSEKYHFDYEAIQEEAVTMEDKPASASTNREYGFDGEESLYPEADIKSPKSEAPKWGSGTKAERKVTQGYGKAGGHRDNSGGFECEMKVKDGKVMRNKRDVWSVNVRPNKETHFATYPQELIAPCIRAGCEEGGVVLDPFMGSGTTGIVARKLNRKYIGFELNPEYRQMAERRINNEGEGLFSQ